MCSLAKAKGVELGSRVAGNDSFECRVTRKGELTVRWIGAEKSRIGCRGKIVECQVDQGKEKVEGVKGEKVGCLWQRRELSVRKQGNGSQSVR